MSKPLTVEECEMLIKHDFTMIDPVTGKLWKLRRKSVTKPGLYRHYKGPHYVVDSVVTDATNSEKYVWKVLYWSVTHGRSDMHVRTETEFHETVTWPDGKRRSRFCQVWSDGVSLLVDGVTHILKHGLSLCEFTVLTPGNWPEGHKWVGFDDKENLDKATCTGCKSKAL